MPKYVKNLLGHPHILSIFYRVHGSNIGTLLLTLRLSVYYTTSSNSLSIACRYWHISYRTSLVQAIDAYMYNNDTNVIPLDKE